MAAAIFAGVSAVASIAGGIFGASNASSQNAQARDNQEKQQKLLNEQARLQNEYNKQEFEAQKENYRKQAEYNFETAVQKWQYDTTIRALSEKVDAQKYLLNAQNSQKQLTFNDIAEAQGQTRRQSALEDASAEFAFNRQDLLVAALQAEGKAMLGQAGGSMVKRVQSTQAQIGRDLAVLDASLTGELKASNLESFDISLGKYSADARVEAARMLRPERLPDIPTPMKPPEPTWVEPMKIIPGMAAPAQQQSVFAPLISGIGSAAGSLASIDWSSPNSGGVFTQGGGGNTAGYIADPYAGNFGGGQTFNYSSPTSYTPQFSYGGLS